MNASDTTPTIEYTYQLLFESLFHAGRALSFPCDSVGRVSLDELSERARDNYLFARAVVGRDYSVPIVIEARKPRLPAATRSR